MIIYHTRQNVDLSKLTVFADDNSVITIRHDTRLTNLPTFFSVCYMIGWSEYFVVPCQQYYTGLT